MKLLEVQPEFKQLESNKKPLTDKERAKCIEKKAVWNNHPNPKYNPIPAVWKSVDKNNKTTYITNTHRAYAKASTLKGAINKYHSFIKGTA